MGLNTISELPDSAAATGTELVEVSQLSATVDITAITISALAADNSYNDSGAGFIAAGFAVGNRVNVAGFTGNVANNILKGTITALTTAKMTIGGADGNVIVDDAAGESVTITKWESRRMTSQEIADLAGSGLPAGGADGDVLTKQSAGDFDADWEAPTGGGGGGGGTPMPFPQVADFTNTNFHAASSTTNRSAGVQLTGAAAQSGFAFAYQAAPATPWTAYMCMDAHFSMAQYPEVALICRNSANSKAIMAGIASREVGPASYGHSCMIERFTNLTTYTSAISNYPTISLPRWWKLHNDGTTLSWFNSFDGRNWMPAATEALSGFIGAVDQIGFGIQSVPNGGVGMISYFGFTDPAPYLGAVSHGTAQGTTFPGTPTAGDRFYRTDRNLEYYWNATVGQWLSTTLYRLEFPFNNVNTTAIINTGSFFAGMPFGNDHAIFVEKFFVLSNMSTGSTASNYFVSQLNLNPSHSNAGQLSNQGTTQNADILLEMAINEIVPSTNTSFSVDTYETGTASAIIVPAISYRLVG